MVVPIRAQVTTEAPAKVEKVSKKNEEGVVVNKFKPKNPYIGRCLLNTKITGDDAPGETWHMVFSTEGVFLDLLPSDCGEFHRRKKKSCFKYLFFLLFYFC